MPLVVGALAVGFAAIALRPPDPASAARSRLRVLEAPASPVAVPSAEPLPNSRMIGPSVLAQRTPLPSLPPLLTLPASAATPVPITTSEAAREVLLTASDRSRPLVYRLEDGRMFVVQQAPTNRGRPVLATYTYEEGMVRGLPGQFFTSNVGPLRALVWWTEGAASYYLYSGTLNLRELLRVADQLR